MNLRRSAIGTIAAFSLLGAVIPAAAADEPPSPDAPLATAAAPSPTAIWTTAPQPAPAPQAGWVWSNGGWYFYKAGEPRTGWIPDGGAWYYLKSDGAMATSWAHAGEPQ